MIGISNPYTYGYGTSATSFNPYQYQQAKTMSSLNSIFNSNKDNSYIKKLSTESTSFLKSYQSKMSSLLGAAEKLSTDSPNSLWNKLEVSSSDKKVLDVQTSFTPRARESYQVDVQQIAKEQVSNTSKVAGNGLANAPGGSFSIETKNGNFTVNASAIKEDGTTKTNKEMYADLAKQVNEQDMGVKAQVISENGEVFLRFTGEETGAANSFSVSDSTVSQTAQDLMYSVSKDGQSAESFTSSKNTADLSYNISVSFKEVGSSTVTVAPDTSKLSAAVKDLVAQYNDSLTFLADNAEKGVGVQKQLDRMLQSPAAKRSMELAGITMEKNGKLKFDETEFAKALEKDPELTRETIGGAVGLAEGIRKDAVSALKEPANRLVSQEVKVQQQEKLQDPMNFMSMYNRNGTYNLMNYYAVGALMNIGI